MTPKRSKLLNHGGHFTEPEKKWMRQQLSRFIVVDGRRMVPVPGENRTQTSAAALQDEFKIEFDELFPYRNPNPPAPRRVRNEYRSLKFLQKTWQEAGRVRTLHQFARYLHSSGCRKSITGFANIRIELIV